MPVNNPIGGPPLPSRLSASEADSVSADRSAPQPVDEQAAAPHSPVPSRPMVRGQHSLQELQLRHAMSGSQGPRGNHAEGVDPGVACGRGLPRRSELVVGPPLSLQAREEFLAHSAADRLRFREGPTAEAFNHRPGDGIETSGSVQSSDTFSMSSSELSDFAADAFDDSYADSDASCSSLSDFGMGLSREELLASWDSWAHSAPTTEGRAEAVRRLIVCLDSDASELDLMCLSLTGLPEHLPSSITSVHLAHNELTALPENLPESLEYLCVSGNCLTSLPDHLPDGLRVLDVAENLIDHLPATLPASLKELDVSHNRLAQLPETLPDGLEELCAYGNLLLALPENLPQGLESLRADGNQLTTLPENIMYRLGAGCVIRLDYNPLAQRVLNRLRELTSAPDYCGPSFSFSMDDASGRPPARALHEAVASWPGVEPQTVRAGDFSQFLDYLKDTVNFRNPAFQLSVAEWLTHLQERPDLRRDTFLISQDASTRCEDRVSLTFNAMRQARLASDVQLGDYDHRLPELIGVGRGMFRMDQLELIARAKVKTLNFVDEIEVYLAYQVKLREPLALPIDTPDMRYFDVAYVTSDDLSRAQERVLSAEREGFANYLSSDWQPWQSVLQRLDPEGHERAREELVEAMEDKFPSRLQARLQQMGLQGDPDAERGMGAHIKTEIAHEVRGRRSHDFLQNRGLLALLNPNG